MLRSSCFIMTETSRRQFPLAVLLQQGAFFLLERRTNWWSVCIRSTIFGLIFPGALP